MSRRVDRIQQTVWDLAAPRRLPNGSLVVEMALAYPGVRGPYPDGALVYTPPEVLADADWLAALAGVPLTEDDVGAHAEGTSLDEPTRIGSILSARWDPDQTAPDATEPGVVIASAVIDTARGIEQIRAGRVGVSPAYDNDDDPEEGSASTGVRYTHRERLRRAPDNVAITYSPRGRSAAARADARHIMTPEQIAELVAALGPMLSEAVTAAVAAALQPAEADAADEGEAGAEAKVDPGPTMADSAAILEAARWAGVKVDPKWTHAQALVAVGRRLTGRADAEPMTESDARTAIAVAAKLAPDAGAARSQWSGLTGSYRADSDTPTVDACGVPYI